MPAPALIATAGASDANSYVESVAEADAVAAGPLAALVGLGVVLTGWNAASTDAKTYALIYAAERIDRMGTLIGVKATDEQARAWPRVNTGTQANENTIPDAVKAAQVAEAAALLIAQTAGDKSAMNGVTSFSLGSKSATIDLGAAAAKAERPYSNSAMAVLRAFGLVGSNLVGTVYLPRG